MSNKVKGVKDFYNATAAEWADKWYSDETMLPLLQKYMMLFNANPRILDAGCGAGYESMRLVNLGADVVGIDISEESIKIARLRNPTCRFELMDCSQLDTSLGIFDGVIAIALLVHIEDSGLQLLSNNFKKIMKPAGFLLVAFVEGDGFSEKRSYIEIGGEQYNRAFYLHQINRIIKVAKNSGFECHDEWFLEQPIGLWKYLVFQAQ
jgi:2-polyprenyl-3-methyl-5-hydroxy-6-metoxy-1,4-benzoquinol methylase